MMLDKVVLLCLGIFLILYGIMNATNLEIV
jgi:hypothetical protein